MKRDQFEYQVEERVYEDATFQKEYTKALKKNKNMFCELQSLKSENHRLQKQLSIA